MENLYYFAKNSDRVYLVVENVDGSLFITMDGEESIPNAGAFIKGLGGIEAVKSKCVRDSRSLVEIRENIEAQRKEAKQAAEKRRRERVQEKANEARRALDTLIAKSEGGIIEANIDNVTIVARYLSVTNWGLWTLPQMSIGYRANQYEGGAVTMVFDQPIDVYGEMESKLAFFAGPCELTKYKHVR